VRTAGGATHEVADGVCAARGGQEAGIAGAGEDGGEDAGDAGEGRVPVGPAPERGPGEIHTARPQAAPDKAHA
jgi:hypothetical protein